MALAISTITSSVAALTVSGVTILDMDELQDTFAARDCPVLYPEPGNFVQNVDVAWDSFNGRKTVTYTLRYTFLYEPVGANRLNLAGYSGMVDKAFEILDVIIANDDLTGAIDVTPHAEEFGPVPDPMGNMFHGCRVTLDVMEFVN